MSRSRRSIFTFLSGITYTAVTVVVGFLSVPFLLGWLGSESFGACRALTDWYGQFKLLELGVGSALLPMLSRAVGRRDVGRTRQILRAGLRAYVVITLGFLATALLLAVVVTRLISVEDGYIGDLRTAALFGALGFLITPLAPFRLLADARQDGLSVNGFLLLQSLATTALALVLAWGGWGITGQVIAFAAATIVCQGLLAVKVYVGLLRTPGDDVCDGIPREVWRELWSLSPPTFFRQVCTRVGLLSDTILVALLLQPALVVPMVITQRLAALAQTQVQGVASASWAGLAELHALGRQDLFRRRLLELTTLVGVLCIAVLAPITAFNESFVARWVGPDRFAGNVFTLVAAANALLLCLFTLWDSCFVGTGQIARVIPLTGVSTLLNLAVSVALTFRLGILGPLLGTLTALLIGTGFWMPVLIQRNFQVPLTQLLRATLAPIVIGVPYWALTWWFAHAYPPHGWLDLAARMAGSTLLYLAVAWAVIFGSDERALWRLRLRLLLRPRPAV
jgi:O-antigen/teichoic acid export membrane protein